MMPVTIFLRDDWWKELCAGAEVDSHACPQCEGNGTGWPSSVGYDSAGDCTLCCGSGKCEMSEPLGGADCSEAA